MWSPRDRKPIITISFVFIIAVLSNSYTNFIFNEPCASKVYCYGPLLHVVQTARIFNDSKTFVDMKMRFPAPQMIDNFNAFMKMTNNSPTKQQVWTFVHKNFDDGDELQHWHPPDYKENPSFLRRIHDPEVRNFARDLVHRWPQLARTVKPEVKKAPKRYSFIAVPSGFIIPGGRFREYYYWDSYWIIKGLLISEMQFTARGILDNFVHMIKMFGFVPSAGRIYYLNRSDPPLLTKMVLAYYLYTRDKKWLLNNVRYLEEELKFWLNNRTTTITKNSEQYLVAYYSVVKDGPRPEAYLEDYKIAQHFARSRDRNLFYYEIKSATESGWDFSSRWFVDQDGGNTYSDRAHILIHTRIREIIPVDLNAYLCEAFQILSFFHEELHDQHSSMYWHKMHTAWKQTVKDVFFDPNDGIWYDYNYRLRRPRKHFFASNFAPLWTDCIDHDKRKDYGHRALMYLEGSRALDTPGGIAASLTETDEQWDFPNAWAPLQSLVVQGLDQSGDPEAIYEAKTIALKWLSSVMKGFRETGEIFEKYDVVNPGKYGGGGEYNVQTGFGWTNGVALEFIYRYFYNPQIYRHWDITESEEPWDLEMDKLGSSRKFD